MTEVGRPILSKYTVKTDLMQLFATVGAKGESFDVDELLEFLKNYIMLRELYNPKNPFEINCEGDQLAIVFGSAKFNMLWAQRKLRSLLQPVVNDRFGGESSTQILNGTRKRKLPSEAEASGSCSSKRQLTSPLHFEFLVGPSYDSGKETDYSYQGYETVLAKDSTDEFDSEPDIIDVAEQEVYVDCDDEVYLDFESDVSFEYEVMSLPSDHDSNDSISDHNVVAEIIVQEADSDLEFWADSSNCDSATDDPDITDGDKWQCKHCLRHSNPKIRYCEHCWQLRQNWLPERNRRPPKRLRKKRKKDEVVTKPRRRRRMRATSENLSESDTLKSIVHSTEKLIEPFSPVQLEEMNLPGPSTSSQEKDSSQSSSVCFLCLERPLDGCIVHGSMGHMMGCYTCLQKLKSKEQPCPLCRRPILRVIRVIQDGNAQV